MSKARFRTHAFLKSIIGKDLITDDNLAVLELVKNAFDAGSSKVDLIFNNILHNDDSPKKRKPTQNSSMLIIRDQGSGMSEDDIINKWLNIAYSEKKVKREEYGRVLAGNKGVGRFSCDRLGRFLTLYSRKIGGPYNRLFIDWNLFEKDGRIDFNIQDVELDIEPQKEKDFVETSGYPKFGSGTILQISCLREYLNAKKIQGLKRQLERLINPNQAFKKNKFIVKITAEEFLEFDKGQETSQKINAEVKNRIFENLDFRTTSIQSNIDEGGEYITTTLQDRGNEIFELREKNKFSKLANINISIFYLNTYAKAYFTKQTGIKSVDFGSIFLFINGFRVPPYGNSGDDWLNMESRKGQGHSRFLGTREVVGRIEVNDKDERFKIISNRSGVVNNIAFEQLTKETKPFGYFYKTFRRLERFVVEGIKWDSSPVDSTIIEKQVHGKNWDESKEVYKESELDRNKRILQVIKRIIDSKAGEVISLTINENFVRKIVNEQIEKAKTEFQSIVGVLAEKSKELDPVAIGEVLQKLYQNSEEIATFSNVLSKYSEETISEIEVLGDLHDSLKSKYAELLETKEKLERQLQVEEAEKRRIAEELEFEKEKNTFLRATSKGLSEDAKGLVHNIKHTSKNIDSSIDSLITKLKSNSYTVKDIFDKLQVIKFNNEKVLKIAKLITRANFKTNENSQVMNVVKYIQQYLAIYNEIFDDDELDITCKTNNSDFVKRLSALDIALVFDDLISNSRKANAKAIFVEFFTLVDGGLRLVISDNGHGVEDKFVENPKAMFDLGVSSGTIDGSGIGLYSVKKILKAMQAEINFLGNNVSLKGATFEIVFRK